MDRVRHSRTHAGNRSGAAERVGDGRAARGRRRAAARRALNRCPHLLSPARASSAEREQPRDKNISLEPDEVHGTHNWSRSINKYNDEQRMNLWYMMCVCVHAIPQLAPSSVGRVRWEGYCGTGRRMKALEHRGRSHPDPLDAVVRARHGPALALLALLLLFEPDALGHGTRLLTPRFGGRAAGTLRCCSFERVHLRTCC